MAEKLLNTRIQLKYDTLENWNAHSEVVLKAGEAAICKVPASVSATNEVVNEEAVLIKIGDGTKTFGELNWIHALAADVYDWAKKEHPDFKDLINLPTIAGKDTEVSVNINLQDKTATVKHTAHAAGTANNKSTASISGSGATGTLKIPKIITNAAGHVTSIAEESVGITMPTIPKVTAKDDDVVVLSASEHEITGSHAKQGPVGGKTVGATAPVTTGAGQTATFKVPNVVVNEYGHVTAAEEHQVQITVPSIPNLSKQAGPNTAAPGEDTVNVVSSIDVSGHKITTNTVSLPTKTYVDTTIANQVAGAVQYLGLASKLGDLKTEGVGKGDFYRASADFNGATSGDLIVALKDRPLAKIDDVNYSLVKSSDDYKGTVTSVQFKAGEAITIDNQSAITESGVVTVSHADTSTQESSQNSDRTYIQSVTLDKFGHVTKLETGTETVVDTNTAHSHSAGVGLAVTGKGGIKGEVEYKANLKSEAKLKYPAVVGTDSDDRLFPVALDSTGKLAVNVPLEAGTKLTRTGVTLNHANTSRTDSTNEVKPEYGATFTVVDTVKSDATGHVTAVNTKTVTMPAAQNLAGGKAATADATVVGGITVSGMTVTPEMKTLVQGQNVKIQGGKNQVTISATDTTYSAAPSGGLKLSGTQFAIDDSLTFVLNCGTSSTVL